MELKVQQRIALSAYFLISGVCFSSWASRIPTIKSFYQLNEAELGNLLFIMPVSSLIGLPVSGWLISKFNSRNPLIFSFVFYALALILVGISTNMYSLVVALFLFAFSLRIVNIAINTQSIAVQKLFPKKIIGTFHGLWSFGGLIGVGISTLMINFKVPIEIHFSLIALLTVLVVVLFKKNLMRNDRPTSGTKLILGKPDTYILLLGLIVFFAAICEGGMFDWSGVYFKEVIKEELFTLGYLIFVVSMTICRFLSDKIVDQLGHKKAYLLSAIFIIFGISTVIIFPYFWPSLVGFCIVGFGVAAMIPMTYALAGTSTKYAPGVTVSIISTYIIVGMLIGPPLVGYLAHLFGLRVSFILFLVAGLMIIPISKLFFKLKAETNI